jgi:endonuclease YncB( thermonuclease family)
VKLFHDVRITMKLAAHVLAMFVCLLVLSASADPLARPEAAALTTRLLDGKVWLVHAIIVRVIDGDTVVVNMDLGWHTWRHDEHVRLHGLDARCITRSRIPGC